MSAKNYENWLMYVEVIVCYISVVFLRHSVVFLIRSTFYCNLKLNSRHAAVVDANDSLAAFGDAMTNICVYDVHTSQHVSDTSTGCVPHCCSLFANRVFVR